MPITPAELKAKREWLGLSAAQIGDVLSVSGRTIRHWEANKHPVPEWATDQILDLIQVTEALEATMAAGPGPILTYPTDQARPADMWLPAAWHRAAAARVAHQTGRDIAYQEDQP